MGGKDRMESGLRFRLRRAARRVARQHVQLDGLRVELSAALLAARRKECDQALSNYRGVLEAHFALENEVFFPALHGLHPEHLSDLEQLVAEHELWTATLNDISVSVDEGSFAVAAARFDALVGDLAGHEMREELLFRKLAAADPAS